jgi:opacity protein-like surface antigen
MRRTQRTVPASNDAIGMHREMAGDVLPYAESQSVTASSHFGGEMSSKRLLMTALAAIPLLTAGAFAQKQELEGLIGRTFISDQGVKNANLFNNNVHFGEGTTFGVNYGYRLKEGFTRLTFEVPAVFNPDEDLNFAANSVPESYKSYFVTPSIRANVFGENAVSPWFSIGGGVGHFSPSSKLEFGGPSAAKGNTTGVMQIGFGLEVRLKEKLLLRGGVRDFWSGTPNLNVDTGKSRQHNYLVGLGVTWRFGKSY